MCWGCDQSVEVEAVERPVTCRCKRPLWTPVEERREPNENLPRPDAHGDAEDRVLFLVEAHGGTSIILPYYGHPSVIAWCPPETQRGVLET